MLGIRPEDVGVAGGHDAFVTTMTPMLVEPTGSDTLLRLPFAGTEITARVHRDHHAVVGAAASFAFDLSHVSVFCRETGDRL